ncbi:MAG: 30S ribosome-binding factor RbfA [Omnitrophica WOR_2 bacterium]
MVNKDRAQRIAARIREELSEILLTESADPRISGVSVTDVTVDRELDYATIFVSALEGAERSKEILAGLEHAQGFLRSELARRIDLRAFPRLRFRWDPTFENAERIERLLASLHSDDTPDGQGEPRPEQGSAMEDGENEADG